MFFCMFVTLMRSPANMTMWKRCAAKFHADPCSQKSDISVLDPIRQKKKFVRGGGGWEARGTRLGGPGNQAGAQGTPSDTRGTERTPSETRGTEPGGGVQK